MALLYTFCSCGSGVKEKATQEMNNTADTLSRLIQAAIKT